eukprot:104541-Pyramimonas_sp.AAC.1
MPPKVMREPRAAGTSPASARRSTPMATCSGWGTGVPGCVRRHATCTGFSTKVRFYQGWPIRIRSIIHYA